MDVYNKATPFVYDHSNGIKNENQKRFQIDQSFDIDDDSWNEAS